MAGTTQLISMLMRERSDEDTSPKLSLLLCESLFAVYASVLIHALTFYETNVLYRLAVHTFNQKMWSALFGGGVKTVVKQRTTSFNESKIDCRLHSEVCHTWRDLQQNPYEFASSLLVFISLNALTFDSSY